MMCITKAWFCVKKLLINADAIGYAQATELLKKIFRCGTILPQFRSIANLFESVMDVSRSQNAM